MIAISTIEIERGVQATAASQQATRLANTISIDIRRSLGFALDPLSIATEGFISPSQTSLAIALFGHLVYESFTDDPIPAPVRKITVLGVLEVDVTGETAQTVVYRNVIPLSTVEVDGSQAQQTVEANKITRLLQYEVESPAPAVQQTRRKTRVSVVTIEV